MDNTVEWSILPTLHKYRILTGDYEKKDGVYSYQVFEDGLLEDWKVNDTAFYGYGIYEQDAVVEAKGTQVQGIQKEISFHIFVIMTGTYFSIDTKMIMLRKDL